MQPLSLATRVRRLKLPALLIATLAAIAVFLVLGHRILAGRGSVEVHSPPIQLGRAAGDAARHVTLTVERPAHLGPKFGLGAVGLSIEAQELASPDLSANHRSLVTLMRQLGPGVLRIGGNSVDYSWWTSQDEPPPEWAASKAHGASVVRPDDLDRLHGLLIATGWRAILGVDFGHFEPTRAADETSFAERVLGSSLLGIEIGNEPNSYGDPIDNFRPSSYSVDNYLEELSAYDVAIRAVAPSTKIYGPDIGLGGESQALQTWLPMIVSDKNIPFAAITLHYYPTKYNNSESVCEPTPVPTALELLSPQVRERENTVIQAMVSAGQMAHRETRISETNTTSSCQSSDGPDTSPVFASALWSLDWALRAASAGIAGLNFHGYFGVCAPNGFNPICAPNDIAERKGQVIARPEYYGLLAARQLEGGHFIPVHISGQGTQNGLTAYATEHPNRVITLALDNLGTETTSVFLKMPRYDRALCRRLTAPSISATGGVTFGRASTKSNGTIRPGRTAIHGSHGTFRLTLEPTSAAIITLRR